MKHDGVGVSPFEQFILIGPPTNKNDIEILFHYPSKQQLIFPLPIIYKYFIYLELARILFEDELIEFFTPLLTRETRNLRSKSMSGLNDIIFNQVGKHSIFFLDSFFNFF